METIAQLRDEPQQWKNQLLRFEDASRREIQDWKDQYQRAEIERIRLSARLDELIAEQLHVRVVVCRTYQALTKLSVEHTCQRKEPFLAGSMRSAHARCEPVRILKAIEYYTALSGKSTVLTFNH